MAFHLNKVSMQHKAYHPCQHPLLSKKPYTIHLQEFVDQQ